MGQEPDRRHPLVEAASVWSTAWADVLKESAEELRDGAQVPPEELKKVAKWLQQTVTKFGATAAVADGPSDRALFAFGDDVIKAFTAVAHTLVCLCRGAGTSLRNEVQIIGSGLATTLEELGAGVGTPSMATNAGKVLERVKRLERISAHNRAAIMRRLLKTLAQLRDQTRELQQVVKGEDGPGLGAIDDEDDFIHSEPELEDHERHLVEAIASAAEFLSEALKDASEHCLRGQQTPTSGGEETTWPLQLLEASAEHTDKAACAIDGLAAHAIGGIDLAAFKADLEQFAKALDGLKGWPAQRAASLSDVLSRIQTQFEALPTD